MASNKRTPDERAKQAAAVLEAMHNGVSLRTACKAVGVPPSTFVDWTTADPVLAEHYARAREALIEQIAEDILEIADEPVGMTDNGSTDSGAVQKQRLQVESRKWLLSKLAPKKYGDKVEQTLVGPNGGPLEVRNMVVEFVKR